MSFDTLALSLHPDFIVLAELDAVTEELIVRYANGAAKRVIATRGAAPTTTPSLGHLAIPFHPDVLRRMVSDDA